MDSNAQADFDIAPGQLLLSRRQVAGLLSISVASVQRLEKAGRLQPIKLFPGPSAKTFFRRSDVLALADRGAADA